MQILLGKGGDDDVDVNDGSQKGSSSVNTQYSRRFPIVMMVWTVMLFMMMLIIAMMMAIVMLMMIKMGIKWVSPAWIW